MTTKLMCNCLLVALAVGAGQAAAQPFKRDWSGWNVSFETTTASGLISDVSGTGTFGSGDMRIIIENRFVGLCEDFTIKLEVTKYTNVVRFGNGDLLYRSLRTGVPSTICFDPANQTARSEVYVEIIGGTGGFAGAYGESVLRAEVTLLTGMGAVTIKEVGEIFGVGGK